MTAPPSTNWNCATVSCAGAEGEALSRVSASFAPRPFPRSCAARRGGTRFAPARARSAAAAGFRARSSSREVPTRDAQRGERARAADAALRVRLRRALSALVLHRDRKRRHAALQSLAGRRPKKRAAGRRRCWISSACRGGGAAGGGTPPARAVSGSRSRARWSMNPRCLIVENLDGALAGEDLQSFSKSSTGAGERFGTTIIATASPALPLQPAATACSTSSPGASPAIRNFCRRAARERAAAGRARHHPRQQIESRARLRLAAAASGATTSPSSTRGAA